MGDLRSVAATAVILLAGCASGGPGGSAPTPAPVPRIDGFAAQPPTVILGQAAQLTWIARDAARLQLDPGGQELTGRTGLEVRPAATTTYTLTASTGSQVATATATVTVVPQPSEGPWVLGYLVGYQRDLQAPAEVDYGALTHVVVGAALPRVDGTLDTSFFLGGQGPAWAQDVVQRAHAAGRKALLMVGGAGFVAGFRATADPSIRSAFVTSLQAVVSAYGFDGVDLDWEPIRITDGAEDDRPALRALLQGLRSALPGKAITVPVGWNNANFNTMAHPFYGELGLLADRVNLMSYQMNWTGDGWQSWHSGALRGHGPTTPSSVEDSVQALLRAGVPRGRIGIGIGFYGQAFETGQWQGGAWIPATSGPYVTGPRQATDRATIRAADNTLSYANLRRYLHDAAAERWDDLAQVPYLSFDPPRSVAAPALTPPLRTGFVTYEDARSIAAKGAYVREQGLGGVILWTVSQGYLGWLPDGERDPLMKSVRAAFLEPGPLQGDLGPNASLAGEPLLPEDSPWRQDVSTAPVDPESAAILAFIGLDRGLKADFGSGTWNGGPIGIPYHVVSSAQAKVAIRPTAYGSESDPGPMPVPPEAPVEGGSAASGDRHVLVLDRDSRILYELYRAFPRGDGCWDADSCAVWDLTSNALRPWGWTSADAAGLPLLPGLVRYDEVAAGAIRHAIRFTVPTTRRAYTAPATHWASSTTRPDAPAMGLRVRLKASTDLSGLPPQARVVGEALKRYGMLLADNGSAFYLSGAPDSRWDNAQLATLARLKGSDLEVVRPGTVHTTHPQGAVPEITAFASVPAGTGRARLTWSATGATRIFLSGVGLVRGSSTEVATGTSYTLTVQGPFGQATRTLVVP